MGAMGTSDAPAPGGSAPPRTSPALWVVAALLGAASLGPLAALGPIDWATGARFTVPLTLAAGASVFLFPTLAGRFGLLARPGLLRAVVLGGFVFAVVSAATGFLNGETFEPATTPAYASVLLAGHDPYTTLLHLAFVTCSGPTSHGWVTCVPETSSTYYVYLPLLTFLQVPFVPYRWVTLACAALVAYRVRRDPVALALLGSPYVALLAANGYNDFPVLLLLTLGFVGTSGRGRAAWEWLSLGTKQFANLVVLAYHIARRDLRGVAVTLAVSLAWVVPFLLLDPRGFVCTAILYEDPGCTSSLGHSLFVHVNYWLWPAWVVAVFHAPLGRRLRGRWGRWGGGGRSGPPPARNEAPATTAAVGPPRGPGMFK